MVEMAAADESGRLCRHGYVMISTIPMMSTIPQSIAPTYHMLLERMAVPILALPLDLDDLSTLVTQTATQVEAKQVRMAPADENDVGQQESGYWDRWPKWPTSI